MGILAWQCFLWERGAPAGAVIELFNFQDVVPTQKLAQHTEGEGKHDEAQHVSFNKAVS